MAASLSPFIDWCTAGDLKLMAEKLRKEGKDVVVSGSKSHLNLSCHQLTFILNWALGSGLLIKDSFFY